MLKIQKKMSNFFRLQQLLDIHDWDHVTPTALNGQPKDYMSTKVITTTATDASLDTRQVTKQSGQTSGDVISDETIASTTTCRAPPYVDYTQRSFSPTELAYLNNVLVPKVIEDPCYPAEQKAAYKDQLAIINRKYGWVTGVY